MMAQEQTSHPVKGPPSVRSKMRLLMPCSICTKGTYYVYYGSTGPVCDACRTFFRRQILVNSKPLLCLKNRNCDIKPKTGSKCTYCRFQKCLNAGMRAEFVVGECKKTNGGLMWRLQHQFPATIALLTSNKPTTDTANHPKSVIMHTSASEEDIDLVNGMMTQDTSHDWFITQMYDDTQGQTVMIPYQGEMQEISQLEQQSYNFEPIMSSIVEDQQYFSATSPGTSSESGFLNASVSAASPSGSHSSSSNSCRTSRTSSLCRPPKIWLTKSPGALIEFRVTAIDKVPCYSTQIEIEVPVKDGVVVGTNCIYSEIIKNIPATPTSQDSRESMNTIFFESRFGSLIFRKLDQNEACDAETFDVEVVSLSSDSRIVLESMTEGLWSKLQQLIISTRFFNNCTTVLYYPPMGYEFDNNNTGESEFKKLLLIIGMDNVTKCVTAGVEVFDFYRQLPLEDQIILLKEGMVGVGFLFLLLIYDRDTNCKIHTALQDQLKIHVSLDTMRENPLAVPIADAFRAVLLSVYDFLQRDHFVICMFVLIYFFQTHPGLSSPEVVHDERMTFFGILAKYIRGKIRAGEWKESYDDIWDNIKAMKPHVSNLNSYFTAMANALEREMQEMNDSHDEQD